MAHNLRQKTTASKTPKNDVPADFWNANDPPDGMSRGMWLAFKSIKQDTMQLNNRVDVIESRTESLETTATDQGRKIAELQSENAKLRLSVSRLQSYGIRTETKHRQLFREIERLQAQTMRDNVIFNFDPETADLHEYEGENSASVVKLFLSKVLSIRNDVYISAAHRTGKWIPNKQRQIVAVIPNSEDRNKIFKNCYRLKDTAHYVQNQIPASQKERKQFAYPAFKDLSKNKANKAAIRQGTLYVKKKAQIQFMKPVLDRPAEVDEDLRDHISVSEEKEEGGSVFQGFSAQAGSLDDVSKVRDALITFYPSVSAASDIVWASRIQLPGESIQENFDSDKDPGTGLELLNAMRKDKIENTVCVATRTCRPGYQHINRRRFELINELCLQAYQK